MHLVNDFKNNTSHRLSFGVFRSNSQHSEMFGNIM